MCNYDYLRNRNTPIGRVHVEDDYPDMEAVIEVARSATNRTRSERKAIIKALLTTSRMLYVRVMDHYPGQYQASKDVHVLMLPGIDYVVAQVGGYEDAMEFCNRLGVRAEYHVYIGLSLGIR